MRNLANLISAEAEWTTQTMISETLEAITRGRESAFQPLVTAIKKFAVDVWEGGLATQVEESSSRSMVGAVEGGPELLTFSLAGRTLITFQGDGHSVTAMAADKERPCRMGLHGINGTIPQALKLIAAVTMTASLGQLRMVVDRDVTVVIP